MYNDSDEDDTLYCRYPTPSSSTHPTTTTTTTAKKGSGGLAPSKSTVYVSNLDYNLTNSDLFTIFSTFGKLARVTILKDKATRRSRGVAFILFVSRNDAVSAAKQMNGKILNGRTLRASIAADNGRAAEYIRRRNYPDKSRCYECGEEGHLSYECPRNLLGKRERPVPKKDRQVSMRKKVAGGGGGGGDEEVEEEEESVVFEEDWAGAVDGGVGERRLVMEQEENKGVKRGKKVKKPSYFSDESGEED